MLTEQEIKFIAYWSQNREKKKKSFLQYIKGLSFALAIGAVIILCISIGWFSRATMVANSKMNPFVLLTGFLLLGVFMSYFYNQYQWETNEQHYIELLSKQQRINKTTSSDN